MTFKSKRIEKAGENKYKVTGDLTLHGVTKEVVLDVEGPTPPTKDPMGKTRAGAQATAKLDRRDFGIAWSKALGGGGLVVGNDVNVTIDVEGVRQYRPETMSRGGADARVKRWSYARPACRGWQSQRGMRATRR
jgi:hypothetical protein